MNTWTDEAKAYLEAYLHQVESLLASQGGDAQEVVNDLRDHVERLAVTGAGALVALSDVKRLLSTVGTPEEVATSWMELGDKRESKDPWAPEYLNAASPTPAPARSSTTWIIAGAAVIFLLPFLVYMIRGEAPGSTVKDETPKGPVAGKGETTPVTDSKENDLVGSWVSVDFVEKVDDFRPGQKAWQGDLFLKTLECFADGRTSIGEQWKDGQIIDQESPVTAPYFVKSLEGRQYLFLPWLSGDVTLRGQKPRYYVLAQSADVGQMLAQAPQREAGREGAVAQSGPADLTGSWKSVDFVAKVEDFKPGAKTWSGELFLTGLDCAPDGGTSLGYTWWADGRVVGQDGRTQAVYQVKTIGDSTYLFLPWLSGDVTIRGMVPKYYVMQKMG